MGISPSSRIFSPIPVTGLKISTTSNVKAVTSNNPVKNYKNTHKSIFNFKFYVSLFQKAESIAAAEVRLEA